MTARGDSKEPAQFEVPAPSRVAALRAGAARPPAAILIAHGMGQQIPFQTLEDVAEGLSRAAEIGSRPPRAETVVVGGERLQRLDLSIRLDDGSERDVHVYEAYWAPLTEGLVSMRDVLGFLVRGGLNGIRAGRKPFHRWLFGQYVRFPAPVRAVVYLELALAVVTSLTVLTAIIFAVVAARLLLLHRPPLWATNAFVHDVTTILNALVCAIAPFAAVLTWAALQRRAKRTIALGKLSIATFVVALWATMAAAIMVVALVVYHTAAGNERSSLFDVTRWSAGAQAFDHGFDVVVTILIAAAIVALAVVHMGRTQRELADDALQHRTTSPGLTRRVRLLFLAILITLAFFAEEVLRRGDLLRLVFAGWHGLSWPLVVGVSLCVRSFLIQYAGDVAAYVQPQILDRFYELRQGIKDTVWRAAHAVYNGPYEDVLLVGHSLGSVVMYDVLNRLILDRQLDPQAPEITSRTRLLLTFGSPLDKTAFIFGIQGTGAEPREALSASTQPLITQPSARPPWVNIWSPWDVISGALDYYDLPRKTNPGPVQNIKDPRATTLLAAHVEYWNNPTLYKTIVRYLAEGRTQK
jgi:hypothetical protein